MKKILLFLIFSIILNANSYQDWIIEQNHLYTNYKKTFDEEFSKSLKEDWSRFNSLYNKNPYKEKKPKVLPKIKKEIKVKREDINKSKKLVIKKIEKQIQHTEDIDTEVKRFKNSKMLMFSFYSNNIKISYDKNNILYLNEYSIEYISRFWDNISSNNYKSTLKQFNDYSNNLNLNDWAKYLLIYNSGLKIYKNKNMANLFTWFYLTKMKYDVKVGFSNNSIYLLSTIDHEVFQVAFFTLDEKRYYVLTANGKIKKIESIFTYKNSYPDANKSLSFVNSREIKFNKNIRTKKLTFKYLNKKYTITSKYSFDLVKFYSTFPQSDYRVYLNSNNSDLLSQTLLKQMQKIIKGKKEVEAVNMILRFVQTSFKYKTDLNNFSYEKVLFPEETIYYNFSDCEDRSIMFTFLIKKLTNLDIVAVKYKNHLASAVAFNSSISGSSFMYKNKKYLISDPTYINANVGMVMPQYKNSRFKIINIK